jgi:uncharacterized protein (TIGR02594 family)
MKTFLEHAISQIGTTEISGNKHNDIILGYAKEAGYDWVNDDETPWCSIFVAAMATRAGLRIPQSINAMARSWLKAGVAIQEPIPGDVVVFYRGDVASIYGHVGIFMGFNKSSTKIYTLGGNQANSVNISAYSASKVLGFIRLQATSNIQIPPPKLCKGDVSTQVGMLQQVLNILGFNCGIIDNHYGNKTFTAIVHLQQHHKQIEQNGIYDVQEHDYIETLLQS